MKDTRRATLCSRLELPLGSAVSGSQRIRRSRNASHAGECIITHSQTTPSARSLASLACSVINLREYATARSTRVLSRLCDAGACIAGGMQVSREGGGIDIRIRYISFKSLSTRIKCIGEKNRTLGILQQFQSFL